MLNPEIEQTWWHIEDQLKPSRCRLFRQVMDFYTKKDYLEYTLPSLDGDISGLQVIGRNSPGELAFIVQDHTLLVNIGDPKNWPNEIKTAGSKKYLRRHVKIEVKYMEEYKKANFGFEFNKWNFSKGYIGYLAMEPPMRPEFMITVPLGMEIENNGKKIELTLIRYKDGITESSDRELPKTKIFNEKLLQLLENLLKFISPQSKNDENSDDFIEIPLKLEDPIITKKDSKRVYIYSINQKEQNLILESSDDYNNLVHVTYYVKNQTSFIGITIFAGILIFFTFVEVFRVLTFNGDPNGVGTPELSMLIALFSFTAFVLTLHKDDYEIPGSIFVSGSILFTIAGMVFILIIYLFK